MHQCHNSAADGSLYSKKVRYQTAGVLTGQVLFTLGLIATDMAIRTSHDKAAPV